MGNVLKKSNSNNIQEKEFKLLLLGTAYSGKSTIFKQVKDIYDERFSNEDRLSYKHIILCNIFYSIRGLCSLCENYQIEFENDKNRVMIFFIN